VVGSWSGRRAGRDPYRGPVTGGDRTRTVSIVDGSSTAPNRLTERPSPSDGMSATAVMALAAAGAALIAMFGERGSFTALTVGFALATLVPWALEAGGVRMPWVLFAVMTLGPAAVIVLVDRNPGGVFPAMLAVVWFMRSHALCWLNWTVLGAAAAIVIGLAVLEGTTHETGTVYFLGGLGVAAVAGTMLRRQEVLVARLRDANARQAAHALVEERTRIAREVHDVVAHSLTVTMLHVTGARRVLANDPARAAEALDRAETVGRESLDSIRQVVGLLRAGDDGDGRSDPLPALDDIPALVEQYRVAGLSVSGDLRLDGVIADPATSLTAFRVVQEALANALQHAPGAPVVLEVGGTPDRSSLRIVAENPTPPSGRQPARERAGLGVRGMTERVRAAGGSLQVGSVDGRVWRVEASLPLRQAVAP
jgi:signal transduction histidine kinase